MKIRFIWHGGTLWWTNILLWKITMLLMGKSTISMAIFHSKMLVHQRVFYIFKGDVINAANILEISHLSMQKISTCLEGTLNLTSHEFLRIYEPGTAPRKTEKTSQPFSIPQIVNFPLRREKSTQPIQVFQIYPHDISNKMIYQQKWLNHIKSHSFDLFRSFFVA